MDGPWVAHVYREMLKGGDVGQRRTSAAHALRTATRWMKEKRLSMARWPILSMSEYSATQPLLTDILLRLVRHRHFEHLRSLTILDFRKTIFLYRFPLIPTAVSSTWICFAISVDSEQQQPHGRSARDTEVPALCQALTPKYMYVKHVLYMFVSVMVVEPVSVVSGANPCPALASAS